MGLNTWDCLKTNTWSSVCFHAVFRLFCIRNHGKFLYCCISTQMLRLFLPDRFSSTSLLVLDRRASSPLASSPHFWRTVESSFYRSFPTQGCILPRVLSTILPLQQLSLLINRGEGWNLTSDVGWWGKMKHNLHGRGSRTALMWSKIKLVIHSCNASADIWASCEPAGLSSLQWLFFALSMLSWLTWDSCKAGEIDYRNPMSAAWNMDWFIVLTHTTPRAVVTGFSEYWDHVHLLIIAGLWECRLVAKLSMRKWGNTNPIKYIYDRL